jgi:FAD:protein FMN transferase
MVIAEGFRCFGSDCAVHVTGDRSITVAAIAVRRSLLAFHERFTRFRDDSELSALNRDPREVVPASAAMVAFVRAAAAAARDTGGLFDPTLLDEIERAGYTRDLAEPVPVTLALEHAPPRRAGRPRPDRRWRSIGADSARSVVVRPPGVRIDSGGLKGLFADLVGPMLQRCDSFAIDCGGDVRLGGAAGTIRPVNVLSPFSGEVLHTFERSAGGVATTGIGRRSWTDASGAPAHHVLDPSTGRPAFTGIVQATAVAASAARAEALATAALLSGPEGAERWLRHGGVVVYDDGSHRVVEARVTPARVVLRQAA